MAKCSTTRVPSNPKRSRSFRRLNKSCSPIFTPNFTNTSTTRCGSNIIRRVAMRRKAGITSTSSGGSVIPMQIKINFLCRDSILAAPLVLDIMLFMDLAQRAGMRGVQEWLSFFFKAPMTAPGLYPEHDIFIQSMKLKNTLRWMKGEQLITHLGLEYYD